MESETRKRRTNVDMLNGRIFGKLCLVAIPLALSSVLQQLFNAADVAVVGRFASKQAMAAVGSNAPVIAIIVTLFTGLSIGANVLIAGLIGGGKQKQVNDAVHTSFTIALLSGVIMMVLGILTARPILLLLDTPSDVLELATMYLRIYFLGMPFVMIYNFGSALFRAIGDTARPLACLTVSGIINVGLNVLFVVVCGRSADGVAAATVISNCISASLILFMLMREKGILHLDLRKLSIRKEYLIKIIRIGGPAGLQGMIFSLSNVVIQAAVNSFGSDCVAGNSAAMNFDYTTYFVVNGFAQAAMTFISQNYAAGKFDRCRKTVRTAVLSSLGIAWLVAGGFFLFRYPLMSLFTTDPEVVRYAMVRVRVIAILEPLTTLYEVPGSSLRGMGRSLLPAVLTMLGCCGLRLVYVLPMMSRFTSFWQVGIIYPITWIVTGTATILAYLIITRKIFRKAGA